MKKLLLLGCLASCLAMADPIDDATIMELREEVNKMEEEKRIAKQKAKEEEAAKAARDAYNNAGNLPPAPPPPGSAPGMYPPQGGVASQLTHGGTSDSRLPSMPATSLAPTPAAPNPANPSSTTPAPVAPSTTNTVSPSEAAPPAQVNTAAPSSEATPAAHTPAPIDTNTKGASEASKASQPSTNESGEATAPNQPSPADPNASQATPAMDTSNMANSSEDSPPTWKQKRLSWIVGAALGGGLSTKFNGVGVSLLDVFAQGGVAYKVGENHGARAYAIFSYSSLGDKNVFGLGGGADYYYSFGMVGIFAGAYVNVPLSVLSTPDVVIQGGATIAVIDDKLSIDIKVGYPVLADKAIQRTLVYGVGIFYKI